jgi:predicted AAA+ superfamily ATPase
MARARPVVTVAGPRHSGKTTLVKTIFPYHRYVNLGTPDAREFAEKDPQGFLKEYSGGAGLIIDEFLRVPRLSYHIREALTERKQPGRFILTSSHMPLKFSATGQSVRHPATQILLPPSIRELANAKFNLERDEYIYRGFMPRIYSEKIDPRTVHINYHTFFVKHDVKNLIYLEDQSAFWRLLKLLAERIGQAINHTTLAGEVGISQTTLSEWINALEACFVIFRLPAYPTSFGKKVQKTPKLYFTDVGMAAALLKITSAEQVFRDPMVGNLFENMVVADALKCRYNTGQSADMFYYRSQNAIEIDLIMNKGRYIMPIEIKSCAQPNASFTKNIKLFTRLSKKIKHGCVVYSGELREKKGEPKFVNFKNIGALVGEWGV